VIEQAPGIKVGDRVRVLETLVTDLLLGEAVAR
jgi:hypothetical protein